MIRLADELDDLAERLGVPKLSSFFDWNEMARVADAELEDLEEGDSNGDETGEEEVLDVTAQSLAQREATGNWFELAEGLTTVRALVQHLAKHENALTLPTSSKRDFDRYRNELLDEFLLCERFLNEAESLRNKFRLLIVP